MVLVGPTIVVVVSYTVKVKVERVWHEQADASQDDVVPVLVHMEANAGTVFWGGAAAREIVVLFLVLIVRFSKHRLGSWLSVTPICVAWISLHLHIEGRGRAKCRCDSDNAGLRIDAAEWPLRFEL